jgi:hypothetical protein
MKLEHLKIAMLAVSMLAAFFLVTALLGLWFGHHPHLRKTIGALLVLPASWTAIGVWALCFPRVWSLGPVASWKTTVPTLLLGGNAAASLYILTNISEGRGVFAIFAICNLLIGCVVWGLAMMFITGDYL